MSRRTRGNPIVTQDATLGARRGTIAAIGDSIFEYGGGLPSYLSYSSRGPWVWAQVLTGQRLKFLGNFGVAGQTMAQIVARIGVPLALRPAVLIIEGGTNSVVAGVTSASIAASWTTAIKACLAQGTVPIVLTIMPNTTATSPQRTVMGEANLWLRTTGASLGAVVVDAHQVVAGASTSSQFIWADSYSIDHIHPATPGAARLGYAIAQALAPYTAGLPGPCLSTGEPRNILGNGFGATVGDTTTPTGWTVQTVAGTPATYTQVARPTMEARWQQVAVPTGTHKSQFYRDRQMASSGLVVGDVIQGAVEFETDNDWDAVLAGTTPHSFGAQLQAYNASSTLLGLIDALGTPSENFGFRPASGVLLTPPFTIPATTDFVRLVLSKYGGGTIRYSLPTLFKT